MNDPLLFLLLVLASYRLWRLLGRDEITKLDRERLLAHDRVWLTAAIECPWCLGSYCAFAVVGLTWFFQSLPLPGLWFPAVACGVGLIGKWDE